MLGLELAQQMEILMQDFVAFVAAAAIAGAVGPQRDRVGQNDRSFGVSLAGPARCEPARCCLYAASGATSFCEAPIGGWPDTG